ncbi:MAG TPA: hypothetical protein VGA42_00100 [Gemmatimonadales bacterium]
MFDSPFIVPVVVVPSILMFILLVGPFRRPLIRSMTRKAEGAEGGLLHEDVAEQAERLAEAERRIGELEERLDFTERLLTSGKTEKRD